MPNIVKGSKQDRMVVVPHRPLRRVILVTLLLLGVSGGISLAGWLGYRYAGSEGQIALTESGRLAVQLAELENENIKLRRQVALLDRSNVMDRQANDEVQSTIMELRERISELEQDVVFYRQAMSEDFEDVGLVVGQMDVETTETPGLFSYKLVMRQQENSGDAFLTGHVNVNVVGKQGEEPLVIPLKDLTEDEDLLDIKLRYRYFQNIEGKLTLPAGFVPEKIDIKAVATAPMAKTVSKSFSWIVEGD